jgi:hypothetical protein
MLRDLKPDLAYWGDVFGSDRIRPVHKLINKVRARDLIFTGKSEYLKFLNNDEQRGWWMNTKSEHYALLCWLSDQVDHQTIYDIGTFQGMSALALASNNNNKVITYDVQDWSPNRVSSLDNIEFVIGDFFKDDGLLRSPLISFDVDPHDGVIEEKFLRWLDDARYQGIVFFDDIHLNEPMQRMWDSIEREKHDLTEFGHWSGSGLVIYA